MLLPFGSFSEVHLLDQSLSESNGGEADESFIGLVPNRDRLLMAVLTARKLTIVSGHPKVKLTGIRRSLECYQSKGSNTSVQWKTTSDMLVVATGKGYLLFYQLQFQTDSKCFDLVDPHSGGRSSTTKGAQQRRSAELFTSKPIPFAEIHPVFSVRLSGLLVKMLVCRDEITVSLVDGSLQRIQWDGRTCSDPIQLAKVPFYFDQLQSRAEFLMPGSTFIKDIAFSPLIGGYAVVLQGGQAALLTTPILVAAGGVLASGNNPGSVPPGSGTRGTAASKDACRCVWAGGVSNAVCVTVCHKYRLLTLGRLDGRVSAYCVDDATGALVQVYEVGLDPVVCGTDLVENVGPVRMMRWSPLGTAIAVCWKLRGVVALWSTFGSLLWCSHGSSEPDDVGSFGGISLLGMDSVDALDWGHDGMELWVSGIGKSLEDSTEYDGDGKSNNKILVNRARAGFLRCWRSVRCSDSLNDSNLAVENDSTNKDSHFKSQSGPGTPTNHDLSNPSLSESPSILLMSDSEIGISKATDSESTGFVSNHWDWIRPPHSYLGVHWPIRFCAFEYKTRSLAISGSRGLAWCSVATRKWKLFGNETQERDFMVSCGLDWWGEFVVAACYDSVAERDKLRFYPKSCNLDNMFMTALEVENQVVMFVVKRDVLLLFDVTGRLFLYTLVQVKSKHGFPAVQVVKQSELLINELIPHPACVISIQIASLSYDQSSPRFLDDLDSIFVNIAGRLFMLRPLSQVPEGGPVSVNQAIASYQLNQPHVVAYCVEEFWSYADASRLNTSDKPHLSQAVWIQCGAAGLNVWMPLFTSKDSPVGFNPNSSSSGFLSRRIMLPIELAIRPFLFTNNACVAVGVEHLVHSRVFDESLPDGGVVYLTIERKSEMYLHHILRQLLKRNLGLYALQIAATCRNLAHFTHVLELLLHVVLEEEATSSAPIPDPLLPRVVAFIQEFPEFLEVVAHCARKTEINLWGHLFSSVGDPKELYEVCVREKRLETAASFLIVLQNLESGWSSRDMAVNLLDASLNNQKWEISREIVRFLSCIDPRDIDAPVRSLKTSVKEIAGPRFSVSSPVEFDEDFDSLVFRPPNAPRQRNYSVTSGSESPPEHPLGQQKLSLGSKQPTNRMDKVSSGGSLSDANYKGSHHYCDTKVTHNHAGGGAGMKSEKQTLHKSVSDPRSSPPKRQSRRMPTGDPGKSNATHFYLDLILRQHARKLLENYRLYELGLFSASLEFHLVLWLCKERAKAGRIRDWGLALQQVHSEFNWPFPRTGFGSRNGESNARDSVTSVDSKSPLRVITGQDSVDSGIPATNHLPPASSGNAADLRQTQIGDNYGAGHSRAGTASHTVAETRNLLLQQKLIPGSGNGKGDHMLCSDARLTLELLTSPMSEFGGGTEMTEDSSVFDRGDGGFEDHDIANSPTDFLNNVDWNHSTMERMCSELCENRGSPENEVRLRFLQQVFSEAYCLDWLIIICLVLRDIVTLSRSINPFTVAKWPLDTVPHLRQGFAQLESWASTQCHGYQTLIFAFKQTLESSTSSAKKSFGGVVVNGSAASHQNIISSKFDYPPPVAGSVRRLTSISDNSTDGVTAASGTIDQNLVVADILSPVGHKRNPVAKYPAGFQKQGTGSSVTTHQISSNHNNNHNPKSQSCHTVKNNNASNELDKVGAERIFDNSIAASEFPIKWSDYSDIADAQFESNVDLVGAYTPTTRSECVIS